MFGGGGWGGGDLQRFLVGVQLLYLAENIILLEEIHLCDCVRMHANVHVPPRPPPPQTAWNSRLGHKTGTLSAFLLSDVCLE